MFLRDKRFKLWHSVVVAVLANTHRLVTRLQDRGFTEEQAEGITEVIQEIDLAEVTTKGDLLQLELKLEKQIADAKAEILKWVVPLMLGQLASFAVVVKWLLG